MCEVFNFYFIFVKELFVYVAIVPFGQKKLFESILTVFVFMFIFYIETSPTLQYCYRSKKCFGEKAENCVGTLLTKDDCCDKHKGGSWGLTGYSCTSCVKRMLGFHIYIFLQ